MAIIELAARMLGSLKLMRPVLMTGTVAMIGLMPAALSNEIGSQTQKPFALVIIYWRVDFCNPIVFICSPSFLQCIFTEK